MIPATTKVVAIGNKKNFSKTPKIVWRNVVVSPIISITNFFLARQSLNSVNKEGGVEECGETLKLAYN